MYLTNWKVVTRGNEYGGVDRYAEGNIYNDENGRFDNGMKIRTSKIKVWTQRYDGTGEIVTQNNTYQLKGAKA